MKIAILAWGSLVERPGTLRLASEWQSGGPTLPVEFSRRSKGGRLTLVVDAVNGRSVPTLFATSVFSKLADAIKDLRDREETITEHIGYATRDGADHRSTDSIIEWLAGSDFDAVIWTALPSNFQEKMNVPFSVDKAADYLRDLPAETKKIALEYFRIAPPHVMTPLRERLIADGVL